MGELVKRCGYNGHQDGCRVLRKTQGGLFSPSPVHYRIFGLTPRMEPVERDDAVKNDASVVIDIVVMHFIHLEH